VRVVLDSNVLLAAFGTRGLCDALLDVCLASHEVYICEPMLAELKDHLQDKFKMPSALAAERVEFLRAHASLVEPAAVPRSACRDPDDLMVLGTAVAAHADHIVTGDKDLLSLGKYEAVPIVSLRQFYDKLKG
jgi:putative PIN family toxin of toxin-antitoxin system